MNGMHHIGAACVVRSHATDRIVPHAWAQVLHNQMIPATLTRPGIWPEPQGGSDMVNHTRPAKANKVKAGDALPRTKTIERIGSQIEPQANGCWLWRGKTDTYGKMRDHGQSKLVHRYVYEVLKGYIPDDHVLHHHCLTPGCVNPAHLEPMTNSDHRALHHRLD